MNVDQWNALSQAARTIARRDAAATGAAYGSVMIAIETEALRTVTLPDADDYAAWRYGQAEAELLDTYDEEYTAALEERAS